LLYTSIPSSKPERTLTHISCKASDNRDSLRLYSCVFSVPSVLLCGRDKGASLRSVCWQLPAERLMTDCRLIQSELSPDTRTHCFNTGRGVCVCVSEETFYDATFLQLRQCLQRQGHGFDSQGKQELMRM